METIYDLAFKAQWFKSDFVDIINKVADVDPELAREILEHVEYAQTYEKLKCYKPYGHPDTLKIEGWSKKPWQLNFHNSGLDHQERMLCAANRVGKCISIRSIVETTTGPKKMKDIFGKECNVLTYPDYEPRKVLSWVKKPKEECFRFVMADGQWVEAPLGHRILVGSDYLFVSELLKLLPEDVFSRHQSNSVFSQLARALDVRRYFRKLRDCLDDYLMDRRLYGEQPLLEEDSVQVFAPLPSDARQHTSVLCKMDDLANKCINNLSRFSFRLSNLGDVLLTSVRSFLHLAPSFSFAYQSLIGSNQSALRLYEAECPAQPSHELRHQKYLDFSSSTPDLSFAINQIVSVYSVGSKTLYDMEVEDRHNYIAGGLVHHNTNGAAPEVAMHATGDYPDWWEGRRFDKPVLVWVGSPTNESSRDIVQKALLGGSSKEEIGLGWIPASSIVGTPKLRQCGISGVVETVKVRHVSGGVSTIVFKSYEQGWRKFQGTEPEIVWLDEEPDDNEAQGGIYTECLTRLLTSHGIMMVTFTPLLGVTKLVEHFQTGGEGVYLDTATWDDAPHLDKVERERLAASYPDHEREARVRGVPMMGEGKIFTTPEDMVLVDPFPIPLYYARIKGIDFGGGQGGHPAAFCDIAWDRDKDIIYVTDTWKKKNVSTDEHVERINKNDPWVPVAWPHDGNNTQKGGGRKLKEYYKDAKLLSYTARYENDKGGAQPVEPIIREMSDMFQQGRLKIFSTCTDARDEYRNYHRKGGKVTKVRDDVLKAIMYALMMRRYALTQQRRVQITQMPRALTT